MKDNPEHAVGHRRWIPTEQQLPMTEEAGNFSLKNPVDRIDPSKAYTLIGANVMILFAL